MTFSTAIASTIAFGALGTYAIYKYTKKTKCTYPTFEYKVFESEEYTITNPARVYKYNVTTGSFADLESAYKRDLLGNYKKKEHVDKLVKEYLEKNSITQKRVVVDTEGYVADINIDTNINPKTLVFDLENNSLYEAGLDGKNCNSSSKL